MFCKQTYIGSIHYFNFLKYASLRLNRSGDHGWVGGVMFTNVHLKKQDMHENAFQFVPAIYLNMELMFEIYCHARACVCVKEHRSAMVAHLRCCWHSTCVFSIWDGSVAVDFPGNIQHLFLVCLLHAQHFLMFYCFTQYSPKTENWSNFSF